MPLANDLSARLDAGAVVDGLLGRLRPQQDALGAVQAPPVDTGSIDQTMAGFDTGALAAPIGNLVRQGQGGLQAIGLGEVGATVQQVIALLETLEAIGTGDLGLELKALVDQLGAELEGRGAGGEGGAAGVVGTLMRLVSVLSASPRLGALGSLLQGVLASAGTQLPPAVAQVGRWAPAVEGLLRALGGLMTLHTVLEESERLTGIMSQQLDAPTLHRQIDQVLGMLDPALAVRVATTDGQDDLALDALIEALRVPATRLATLREAVAAGMGLGEATLAYLDIPRVQAEVSAAASRLRGIDLSPIAQLLAGALSGLQPLMATDFSRAPAQALDSLLVQAEARIADLATEVTRLDPALLAAPLQQGLQTLTAPLRDLQGLFDRVQADVRSALEAVRSVIVALPVGELAAGIRSLMEPVLRVLQLLADLIATVAAALQTAATQALAALGEVEGAVDDFRVQIQALFGQARQFVEGLNLEAVVGLLSQRVSDFTQTLQAAQMRPVFDTAVQAIGVAADVVEAVPFDLLPDSMKADVDAAVAPIKAVDLPAFELEVENAVGIMPDGRFGPREDLVAAIAGIQAKFDELVAVLREHDPQRFLAQLDEQLSALGDRIAELTPAVSLQPVRHAIDEVKAQVAGFDLEQQLQPLQQIFDDALTALQSQSPAQWLLPLEQRVTDARGALLRLVPLAEWSTALGGLKSQADAALARIDPTQLQALLTQWLEEARELLPAQRAGAQPNADGGADGGAGSSGLEWLGAIITALHRGSGQRMQSQAFEAVQSWLADGGGALALTARSLAIEQAVSRTRDAVAAIDLAPLTASLVTRAQPLRTALLSLTGTLPAGSRHRLALAELAPHFDIAPAWGGLAASRARYLARLERSASLAQTLMRTGLSEVDVVARALREAFNPVRQVLQAVRALVRAAGLQAVDQGIVPMLRAVFEIAPPARLAALTAPVFVALRGRVQALLDAVIVPLQQALVELQNLINAIDLAPLRAAVEGLVQAAVDELRSLSPQTLLAAPLAGFGALKQQVAAFDPLAPLLTVLDALRDTAVRVLDKLSAQQLLADPVAIYREIVDALDALNVQALMAPVFDLLDTIAAEVDSGLDNTVAAFERLQDALPAGGGGSATSVVVEA